MSYRYADLDELVKDLLSASVDNEDETAAIGRVLEGVSNFIDKFCRRPEKYFMPVDESSEPTTRIFIGEGNRFLRIPKHVGSVTIENVHESLYYEHAENGWIYADPNPDPSLVSGFEGFTPRAFIDGYAYKVSARWGFAETPAGIKEAARQLTLRAWETQRGIFGQLTPGAIVIERAMPPFVESILLEFRRREFEIN